MCLEKRGRPLLASSVAVQAGEPSHGRQSIPSLIDFADVPQGEAERLAYLSWKGHVLAELLAQFLTERANPAKE